MMKIYFVPVLSSGTRIEYLVLGMLNESQAMHCGSRMKLESDWNNCPPEILWSIFKYLDVKALTKCMLVSRKWKDIAEKIAQIYNLWEKIVKNEMSNKGASFIKKSRLNWKNVYKNSLLWDYTKAAHIKLLNTYAIKDVKNIKVYKDMFIVIDGVSATYYDMITFDKVSQLECIDMDENDYMLAVLTQDEHDTQEFNLCIKTKEAHQSELQRNVKFVRHFMSGIRLFKLEGNFCYTFSKENIIRVFTSKDTEYTNILIGRCYTSDYDPVIDIHLWNEAGFLVTKWGSVWSFTSLTSGVQKVHKFITPDVVSHYNWVMFDMFSSVIPVTKNSNERVKIQYNESSESILLQCADLSYALAHDNVLILGYRDGRIEIRLPKKNIKNNDAERYFDIQDFCNNIQDCSIVALNVYEILNSHILFVSTNANVYQFQLTYPEDILCNI